MTERILAWYGDDYTGAAAVMEVMAFGGIPSVLFLDPPNTDDLAAFPDARAIGIAGSARARSPEWMAREMPAIFSSLKAIGAGVTLYKICSTLDSSPDVGSIGRAVEIALESFETPVVPVLVAAPPIGRWQAFGTLFARAGDGIYRLDRHPVMSRHPVTPMTEADVALHLSRQTSLRVGCLLLPELASPDHGAQALAAKAKSGQRIVTIDCATDKDLARIGALFREIGWPELFVVGSQGVAYAVVADLVANGQASEANGPKRTDPVDRIAVVSGSVSEVTAAQIDWAEAHGFGLVGFDPASVVDPAATASEIGRATSAALNVLARGQSVIVHSARGPSDPRIATYRAALERTGIDAEEGNLRIGEALGEVLANIERAVSVRRMAIAGGDTSSHATQKLALWALTALAETVPGAALCTGHLRTGGKIEIALKGGQMGTTDFFGRIRSGGAPCE
jgi:uncharacterized protein YgbK (DUF1537 family)